MDYLMFTSHMPGFGQEDVAILDGLPPFHGSWALTNRHDAAFRQGSSLHSATRLANGRSQQDEDRWRSFYDGINFPSSSTEHQRQHSQTAVPAPAVASDTASRLIPGTTMARSSEGQSSCLFQPHPMVHVQLYVELPATAHATQQHMSVVQPHSRQPSLPTFRPAQAFGLPPSEDLPWPWCLMAPPQTAADAAAVRQTAFGHVDAQQAVAAAAAARSTTNPAAASYTSVDNGGGGPAAASAVQHFQGDSYLLANARLLNGHQGQLQEQYPLLPFPQQQQYQQQPDTFQQQEEFRQMQLLAEIEAAPWPNLEPSAQLQPLDFTRLTSSLMTTNCNNRAAATHVPVTPSPTPAAFAATSLVTVTRVSSSLMAAPPSSTAVPGGPCAPVAVGAAGSLAASDGAGGAASTSTSAAAVCREDSLPFATASSYMQSLLLPPPPQPSVTAAGYGTGGDGVMNPFTNAAGGVGSCAPGGMQTTMAAVGSSAVSLHACGDSITSQELCLPCLPALCPSSTALGSGGITAGASELEMKQERVRTEFPRGDGVKAEGCCYPAAAAAADDCARVAEEDEPLADIFMNADAGAVAGSYSDCEDTDILFADVSLSDVDAIAFSGDSGTTTTTTAPDAAVVPGSAATAAAAPANPASGSLYSFTPPLSPPPPAVAAVGPKPGRSGGSGAGTAATAAAAGRSPAAAAGGSTATGSGPGRIGLEVLRGLFEVPVSEVVRRLGVSATDLKRRCRALGIRRWPQRKLMSLRRLGEALRHERELPEERRRALLEQVATNQREILADPDVELAPCLKLLRQAQYKRLFDDRRSGPKHHKNNNRSSTPFAEDSE
ncbi:hypothetical protein Agub_g2689 [Astrephomene gubernaculifera]|uniref:RWP-RK domain-containing protein n=1 Tax=Astrephomene gubernaculifera TaxID=47775 RepID=A0AAD3HHV6_9CHLO|nr:hypothetical protein Agub_g2689 [Astrephomene gubernaculifera]